MTAPQSSHSIVGLRTELLHVTRHELLVNLQLLNARTQSTGLKDPCTLCIPESERSIPESERSIAGLR